MRYILLILLISASAWAASGDYVAPTASYDQGDWIKTDSIFASDNRRATNSGTNAHKIGGKSFGIAVTDGATIDSIWVSLEGSSNGTVIQRAYTVQLSKDGGATGVGDAVLGQWGTTEATAVITGTTNSKWGTTWTEAEIESANFCVTVQKNSTSATPIPKIDQILVRVWWTSASGNKKKIVQQSWETGE